MADKQAAKAADTSTGNGAAPDVQEAGNGDAGRRLTATAETAPRRDGLQIDGFGLPVNGIAREAILAKLRRKDPALDEKLAEGWDDETAGKARELTEATYG